MPAATDRPYLTVHEVLRAGRRRAAGRKDMAAAQSTWDSEGGATKRGSSDEKFGALLWCGLTRDRALPAVRRMNVVGPTGQTGVMVADAWVPAYHLAQGVGICCAATTVNHSAALETVVGG
jgi:hypothetical protein